MLRTDVVMCVETLPLFRKMYRLSEESNFWKQMHQVHAIHFTSAKFLSPIVSNNSQTISNEIMVRILLKIYVLQPL